MEIFEYVRRKNNVPVGCLLAKKTNGKISIGYSLCKKTDKFTKDEAVLRAREKANQEGKFIEVPQSMIKDFGIFVERSKKYFKTDEFANNYYFVTKNNII